MEIQYLAFFILILIFLALFLQQQLKKEMQRIELINNKGESVFIEAELANTSVKKMRGLMFRDSLGENEGMLFIFSAESYHRFWMMNTSIHLDAIHIAKDGTVVDIVAMDPCKSIISCPTYNPAAKSMYVLEVNQGFAKRNGIEINKSKLMLNH
jgi:uncharacterized membrane protein (UPF0127 family)